MWQLSRCQGPQESDELQVVLHEPSGMHDIQDRIFKLSLKRIKNFECKLAVVSITLQRLSVSQLWHSKSLA